MPGILAALGGFLVRGAASWGIWKGLDWLSKRRKRRKGR